MRRREQSSGGGIKPDTARRKRRTGGLSFGCFKNGRHRYYEVESVGTGKSGMMAPYIAFRLAIIWVRISEKIIRISTDKIELMEIVSDKPGAWREQQTSVGVNRVISGIKMNAKRGGIMLKNAK